MRKVGLPLKEFFIWGDDTEYSCRLARFTKLYQVGKSKTKHLKSGDGSQSVCKEQDRNKIPQYHWFYRNRLFINLKYDGLISTNTFQFIFRSLRDVVLSIRSRKIRTAEVPNDPLRAVLGNRVCAVDAEQRQVRSIGLTGAILGTSSGSSDPPRDLPTLLGPPSHSLRMDHPF